MRRNKLPINLSIANLLTPAFLAIGAMLCVPSQIEAAPIYSQVLPEEPIGAFSSSNVLGGQKVADNFILEGMEPITIRSIRFIGGYGLTSPPPLDPPLDELPTDGFRIVFLDDAGGSPGLPIPGGDFSTFAIQSRAPAGGRLLNGSTTPIQHTLDLGEGILLNPSTVYWISITNDPGPDHGWAWARSFGLLDSNTAGTRNDVTTGPWDIFSNGGMWFELNNQNIPEPTSLILSLAFLGIFLIRFRNHPYSKL